MFSTTNNVSRTLTLAVAAAVFSLPAHGQEYDPPARGIDFVDSSMMLGMPLVQTADDPALSDKLGAIVDVLVDSTGGAITHVVIRDPGSVNRALAVADLAWDPEMRRFATELTAVDLAGMSPFDHLSDREAVAAEASAGGGAEMEEASARDRDQPLALSHFSGAIVVGADGEVGSVAAIYVAPAHDAVAFAHVRATDDSATWLLPWSALALDPDQEPGNPPALRLMVDAGALEAASVTSSVSELLVDTDTRGTLYEGLGVPRPGWDPARDHDDSGRDG